MTLLSVTNTVYPLLDIRTQVCANRTQARDRCDKMSHNRCLLVRPSGGRARCTRANAVTRCKGRLPNPPFVVAASALTDEILGALKAVAGFRVTSCELPSLSLGADALGPIEVVQLPI